MNRLTSYGFIFTLIFLAILEGNAQDHLNLVKGFTFSLLIAYGAFFLTWLTIDAVLPVIVLGTVIFGFGGWILTIAVIVFFITGSMLTRLNFDRSHSEKQLIGSEVRRDGIQIWANGFWLAIFCIFWFLFEHEIFLGGAFAVLAVATADTWATETGIRNPGKTFNLATGESVEPGTDGGVSLKGTVFSFLGALLIGFFASQAFQQSPLFTLIFVTLSGFLGSVIDSYIGAIYQSGDKSDTTMLRWNERSSEKQNSIVNWLSTGSGGVIALVLLLLIF